MPTERKAQTIEELAERLRRSPMGVLTDYRGLTVSEITALRRQLREAGGDYVVAKNTLLRIAAEQAGVKGLEPLLEGPTAVAFSDHRLSELAKSLSSYAKTARAFSIKGGYLEGRAISVQDIERIATLPSREQLLAQLMGSMQAPIAGLVNVLNATLSSIVYVLDARRRQLEEQGGGAAAPAAAG